MSSEVTEIPVVTSIAGERAGIRVINPYDEIDIDRMFEIEQSEGMRKNIAESSDDISETKEDLITWMLATKTWRSTKFYAVTADKSADPKHHGEVEGWIRVDRKTSRYGSEERHRYERIMGKKLPDNAPTPIELTSIKRPGSPENLMAGAVLQICHMIAEEDTKTPRRYTPLSKGPIKPRRIVMAYTRRNNPSSKAVLENSGFEHVKENVRWEEGKKDSYDMYVLNWNNYHKIIEKKMEQQLLKRIETHLPDKGPQKVVNFTRLSPKFTARK